MRISLIVVMIFSCNLAFADVDPILFKHFGAYYHSCIVEVKPWNDPSLGKISVVESTCDGKELEDIKLVAVRHKLVFSNVLHYFNYKGYEAHINFNARGRFVAIFLKKPLY